MNLLSDLRVGLRLAVGFGLLLLLVLFMGVFAIHRVQRIHQDVIDVSDVLMPNTERAAAINDGLNEMRRAELQMVLAGGSEAAINEENARIAKQWDLIPKLLGELTTNAQTDAERRDVAQLKDAIESYRASQPKLLEVARQAHVEEGMALVRGDSRKAFRAAGEAMAKLRVLHDAAAHEADEDADAGYEAVLWGIGVLVAVSLATGGVMAWALTRSLTVPLSFAAATADRIADGDLTEFAKSVRGDEMGDLLRALARMQQALNNSVSTVKLSADSIASASQEVSTGGHDLSMRTEQAASNLEETSAAMAQVTETVRQSADSARQARALSLEASNVAAKGGAVVAQVVATMNGIQATSRKIADITGVIDGIAFQTNILALNAAVEAARAGEQGRGFAVVAGEVRTLAQRSAEAAREIKTLIGGSVEQIENGARQVGDAGSTMDEVVSSIAKVNGLIAEIADAIQLQTQSLGEVNTAIGHLDGMTQQNAALVEESAAASESLKVQAAQLSQVVAQFRLQAA